MFFGAGNVVFPLIVGQAASGQAWSAIAGLLITAVGVPFLGLLAMVLYHGDYRAFLNRLGPIPGFLLAVFMLLILGPMGAIPRCIALSCGTLKLYDHDIPIAILSAVGCFIVYIATYRQNRIVGLLGAVLSPLLILSLVAIIFKGLWGQGGSTLQALPRFSAFAFGVVQGYNTMDLLAAFFFSGVLIASLQREAAHGESSEAAVVRSAIASSALGACLLGLIYAGFVLLAARYATILDTASPEALLGTIAAAVLGSAGGLLVSSMVVLACLTTAITLAAVFASFLQDHVLCNRVSYHTSLLLTLVVTFAFANMPFGAIVSMLVPVLIVVYPALLVLTIFNILHKVWDISMVKAPVFLTAMISLFWHQVPQLVAFLF